MSLALKTH